MVSELPADASCQQIAGPARVQDLLAQPRPRPILVSNNCNETLKSICNCVQVVLASLLDTHSVVFVDTKNSNSKLGCGEISNGSINIQG